MGELMNFRFKSEYKLDNDIEIIEFESKGYKKYEGNRTIYYFKHDNAYKFLIDDDVLEVEVNNSYYRFDINNKTEAIIRGDHYSYKVSVTTERLNIFNDKIEISYVLDFVTFKGTYNITLELL